MGLPRHFRSLFYNDRCSSFIALSLNIALLSSSSAQDAKRAVLHYTVKEHRAGISVVEIALETGRYHQIRAQMSAMGHPVVGDRKYGSSSASGSIELQHARFSFPHPISHEQLTFSLE